MQQAVRRERCGWCRSHPGVVGIQECPYCAELEAAARRCRAAECLREAEARVRQFLERRGG